MPYLVATTDNELRGIYRTQALADAAALDGSDWESVQGVVRDADISVNAEILGGWFVVDAPAVARVEASVEIYYGTSGKGFRLRFSAGLLGTDGNGWTVTTGGTGITFDTVSKAVQLPEPTGQALDFLSMLSALSGAYSFDSDYLTGTEGATDFASLGSQTWQASDGSVPTFAGGVDALPIRKAVQEGRPARYTPRQQAAWDAEQGLGRTFPAFVREHVADVDPALVDKVMEFPYQARRALRMVFKNEFTINGNSVTLTDAQFIAWATFIRFGPLDTSVVTSLGQYNIEGLFEIFEEADSPDILTPLGPITWVGLDITQWAGGYPNRLNVDQIEPVVGTYPTEYLNINDDSWLR